MFSVIIPTLNEEKYLPLLLESIKFQKLLPSEIIVADANSTDSTREIAVSFGCKVVEGGGYAKGRNEGASHAKSNILIFLDADTILQNENFFSRVIDTFNTKNADVASCYFMPNDNKAKYYMPVMAMNALKLISHPMNPTLVTGGACIVVKKDVFVKLKGFDENLHAREDNDFFKRACKDGLKYILIPISISISTRRVEKNGFLKAIKLGLMMLLKVIGVKKYEKQYKELVKDYWKNN